MPTDNLLMGKAIASTCPSAADGPFVFLVPVLKERPETGGEFVNTRLAAGLSQERPVTIMDWAALGVTRQTPPDEYQAAGLAPFARFANPGIVLHDTLDYWRAAGLVASLRERGWKVATLGQSAYPERCGRWWSRWRARRRLARYLGASGGPHIVVGEALRDSYVALGVPPTDIVVVRPGFDCAAKPYRPTRRPGAMRIVTAGAYMPSKGQHLAVEAVRLLLQRDGAARGALRLDGYGNKRHDPPFAEALERSVAAANLGDAIVINGPIAQDELWEQFLAADVLCFPAIGEGLGLVLVEAMLAGCVPLVCPSPPLLELVRHGVTGVVAERHPAALATAIEDLRSGRHDLVALSAAARDRALAVARSWPAVIAEFSTALGLRRPAIAATKAASCD